ncbi:hypothetical protein [Leifsonia sp. AG29]|uniref:hypothetical protein n=1 Tax=Leifsonia sp. AG29 TaxID=2598860 RepID=UPI00131BA43D|nr:hypothetical protein [Leifsonia sp. AG29]
MIDAVDAFDSYTQRVVDGARGDRRVLGVALLGSGAERSRIDEWSDHDLLVLARPDAVSELRGDLSWLPDSERLVAVGREWHDGIKVLFRDGRVLELGITDPIRLRSFPVSAFSVVYDSGVLAEGLAQAKANTRVRSGNRGGDAAAVLLVQLVTGIGRVRRGERLSGGHIIRSEAALTLMDLLLDLAGEPHPDPFDGWRRIERVLPEAASRLRSLLDQPVEAAALGILDLAEEVLAPGWKDWPRAAARVARERLSVSAVSQPAPIHIEDRCCEDSGHARS